MNVNTIIDILFWILLWAGIAGSWNLLAGFAGQFSLGHAAYVGIGAYGVVLSAKFLSISPWFGMMVGAACAGLLALVVAGVSLRTRGPFFALMTIAFAEIVRIVAVSWKHLTNGSEGLSLELKVGLKNLYFLDKPPYLLVAFVYACGVIGLCIWIRRSRFGYRLLAVRDDEDAARSLAVPVFAVRVSATVISACLAAVGGGILALYVQYIDPDSTLTFLISVEAALIAIVGGLGRPMGPLLGAALIVPLGQVLRSALGGTLFGLHGVIYGALLIAILFVMPEGLLGGLDRLKRSARKSWSARPRNKVPKGGSSA